MEHNAEKWNEFKLRVTEFCQLVADQVACLADLREGLQRAADHVEKTADGRIRFRYPEIEEEDDDENSEEN